MDKNLFSDRQHIPVATLNQNQTDVENAIGKAVTDLLPISDKVLPTLDEYLITQNSPVNYSVLINSGIAYNGNGIRIVFPTDITPVTATPYPTSPLTLSWMDNSMTQAATPLPNTTYYRLDVIYAEPSGFPDDNVLLDFLSSTGSLFQQTFNQRLLDLASFNVAIGTQSLSSSPPTPSIPADAIALYRVYNYPGATQIYNTTIGSQAYLIDVRSFYSGAVNNFSVTAPSATGTTTTITHNLGSLNITVGIRQAGSSNVGIVYPGSTSTYTPISVVAVDSNNVQITWASSQAANSLVIYISAAA